MAQRDELTAYVKEALLAGRARDEIGAGLAKAGWSPGEVNAALGAWMDDGRVPPTPRPRTVVTARDFFVYVLTFAMLLVGSIFLIALLMAIVDLIWPDDAEYRIYTLESLRFDIAVLIVTAPIFGWLTWTETKRLAKDPGVARSAIRKWMFSLALLLSSFAMIGDLVVIIAGFLNGEMTQAFFLKGASVALVAGMIFAFYRHESRRGEE